jgi:hypothetical protein
VLLVATVLCSLNKRALMAYLIHIFRARDLCDSPKGCDALAADDFAAYSVSDDVNRLEPSDFRHA